MNYRLIIRLIGNVLRIEAFLMLPSILVSLAYESGDVMCFIPIIPVLAVLSFVMMKIPVKDNKFKPKDGFAAVALCWLALSAFGSLPFFLCGYFGSYIDCLFEAISGFTTTGATTLSDIQSLPKGILFWRNFTHWIGGMGVLVFILVIMPSLNASGVNLLRAESPGPSPTRLVPKIKETARIMYLIYIVLTVIEIVLLRVSGLTLYDAMTHSLATAGTGGFSDMNNSVGAFNNVWADYIITVFMFIFGINFTLYYYLLKRDFISFFKDEELRLYFGITLAATLIIAVQITGIAGGFAQALHLASFQVSSAITTTCFYITDYELWPNLSRAILMLLMLTGACAGSTGGGIKLIRILIMFKTARIELNRLIHPKIVKTVRINGKTTENTVITSVFLYCFILFVCFCVSLLIVSTDGKDMMTNIAAVAASISNTGLGFALVGPSGNYAGFSTVSKIVLSFCMLAGRLEFIPVLVLFVPGLWKRSSL